MGDERKIRLYICECGPIIKEAIDLDEMVSRMSLDPRVSSVVRYPTLCSHDGRRWMAEDLAEHLDCRVVVAGCTPKEHEGTFREICRNAQVNPYLLAVANIREHCTWVTDDRGKALEKALALTRGAIARARLLEPLEESSIEADGGVLVIGSGVSGLTAAQLLANAGRKVTVVERSPVAGGRTAVLGDVFPAFECSSCMLQPLVDDVLHHPDVVVMTSSEVVEVLGYYGNFTAKIRRTPRHVDVESCYGCRTCHAVCPVEVESEYDEGLSKRRAIHIPYEGALPNASVIDRDSCLRFGGGGHCDACASACPFGSIDLSQEEEVVEVKAGTVIIATGSETQAVESGDHAGRVIGAMALERMLNSAGPTGGEITIPGGGVPRSIALVHCSDEAGFAPVETCSKICCMSFAKYVGQIGEKLPDCEIHSISWERCVGGKGFKAFADSAEGEDRLRVHRMAPTDRVEGVYGEESGATVELVRGKEREEVAVDLVVVFPPVTGSPGAADIARIFQLKLDRDGFFPEEHERLRPFKTIVEGVLVAGNARGPGDIRDASSEGAAAAGAALSGIVPGRRLAIEPATTRVDTDLCGACRSCVLSCPFKAVSFDLETRVAVVNELLCRGCGTCAAACPSGAMVAKHFTVPQIEAEIRACLGSFETREEDELK